MTRRWSPRAIGALALLAALLWPAVAEAQSSARVTVSDATPVPGQQITISASGFAPGTPALVYFLPEQALGQHTIAADGTLTVPFTIARDSFDGQKQVVVRGFDAEGAPAYVTADMTLVGPPATARLSDRALTPTERLRVTGDRFLGGTQVTIALFPERALLGQATVTGGQSFSTEVAMPELLLNGEHVIVVAGANASGGYSWLELRANVTGGVGDAPAIEAGGQQLLESMLGVTTTSVRPTVTRPTVPGEPLEVGGDDGFGSWILVLVLAVLVAGAIGVLVVTWLRTPEGQRWRKRG